tara:strand:+ start:2557 stop:3009 length:453 start_codon:yes stop_codon:yes gene_type:complete
MATYSFQDVTAAIIGVGGSINLASGAGAAEEGISIEAVQDKNVMTIGADGAGMHSLIADNSATVTVRLLKTSPTNALLQTMYNLQTFSGALHGSNTITVRDISRGDSITLTQCAFKKRASVTYAKEGGMMEWAFDAIRTTQILGIGTPEI